MRYLCAHVSIFTLAIFPVDLTAAEHCEKVVANLTSIAGYYENKFREIESKSESLTLEYRNISGLSAVTAADELGKHDGRQIVINKPTIYVDAKANKYNTSKLTTKMSLVKYDTSKTRFVPKIVGKTPEFLCQDSWIEIGNFKTKGPPKCKTKWKEIVSKVPETFIEPNEIMLKLPDTEAAFLINKHIFPSLSMQYHVQYVKVPDLEKTETSEIYDRLNPKVVEIEKLINELILEYSDLLSETSLETFDCFGVNLGKEREVALEEMNRSILELDSTIDDVKSIGINPWRVPVDNDVVDLYDIRNDLINQRLYINNEFEKIITNMEADKHDILDRL